MLLVALVFYSVVDLKAIVSNNMIFQGNFYIFNLETKRMQLVGSLFKLKLDFSVFDTRKRILRVRVLVVSI